MRLQVRREGKGWIYRIRLEGQAPDPGDPRWFKTRDKAIEAGKRAMANLVRPEPEWEDV